MAKDKVVETTVIDGITLNVLEIEIKDGDKTLTHRYPVPQSVEDLIAWQGVNPDRVKLLDRWAYAEDLKQRASKRESAAAVLPVIATKKYGKLDLVTGEFKDGEVEWAGVPLELAKRLGIIDGAYAMAAAMDQEPGKAIQAARAQLLESKVARERNGKLVAA